ncbi:hypothetical protein [Caulobacter sp. NIBR2454]|uniref:hypothetical protein n=1 Tax=Caulobacter sp. NIBR2454 TaxID=3015996 RepID=UPI0022B5E747|nr:hypothetical protein [Caulobacter sp. NIBR2454]
MRAFIAALILSASATSAFAEICDGKRIATIETDGSFSNGTRQAVLDAVRDGVPLRVGWEVGRPGEPPIVIHWQDAKFVTLFEGQVYAQVSGDRQTPQIGKNDIVLSPGVWASMLDTKGRLVTRLSDRPDPIEQKVRSHWCRVS